MQEIFSNNLALIVINKMDKSYNNQNDRRDGTIKLIAKHIYTIQKNKVFIVEPNIYFIDILFYYIIDSMEKYGNDLPINIVDEFIKTMETLKNHIFTCFLDFSCIYEAKENKYDLCLFSQAIEGYSYFYQTALKGENYKRKYMGFVFYLGDIRSHLEEIKKECNDYQEKKKKVGENDLKKEEFIQELDKLNLVNKNLGNLYEDKANEIENLQKLKSTIIKNPNFLIPIGSKKDFNYDFEFNNVCKICRYNCHLECKCFKKSFCKCMSFKFKCKVCPNKCPNDCHEVSPITFSKCEYRTIDQYFPNDNDYAKIDSTEAKFNYIIQKFEEDREEIKKKRDKIDERLEEIKDDREKMKIDMTSLNKELNAKIKEYNNFVDSMQFSGHLVVWQEELLLYVVKPFFLKKKIYDFVDPKNDKDENCIII